MLTICVATFISAQSAQEHRSEAHGPQEWEQFSEIPLSMQPSPIIRVLNIPGESSGPKAQQILSGTRCSAAFSSHESSHPGCCL